MDYLPAIVSISGAFISCVGAVVTVWLARRGVDAELKGDVNELADAVERISKDQRRQRMRRVRAGEKEAPQGAPEGPAAPPELIQSAPEGLGAVTGKDALRRAVAANRRGMQ